MVHSVAVVDDGVGDSIRDGNRFYLNYLGQGELISFIIFKFGFLFRLNVSYGIVPLLLS